MHGRSGSPRVLLRIPLFRKVRREDWAGSNRRVVRRRILREQPHALRHRRRGDGVQEKLQGFTRTQRRRRDVSGAKTLRDAADGGGGVGEETHRLYGPSTVAED